MVLVSGSLRGYRGQQDENGRYLRGQMPARVGKGHIGVRSARGIKWDRSRSVRMAIEVSRKKKEDTSLGTGRCPVESGRASLESARVRKGLLGIRLLRGNE